ncbi:ribbon-helix-helix protein, CopG family [Aureimonas sp. AU20]|uniref:ribbon-helix-helix protein, CopG family n=1 Tax=Aureimonas sp. AU20 TaxID=1349819 RepID=UPI0012E36B81
MGRPKKREQSVRLSVSLDPTDHAIICRMADEMNISAAWFVRRAISEFVSRQNQSAQTELPLVSIAKRTI